MKILFLTLIQINDVEERNLYTDLIRKLRDEGHDIYIVSPLERRLKKRTTINEQLRIILLKIRIPNIQKTNLLEKGISTLLIEYLFLSGIKKYFSDICFDLVIYSTPPITFTKVVRFIKHRDKAKSYLLLKDIFPQNAVDLRIINNGGILHKYFRQKEKQLYLVSDFIGCMSPANVNYLILNNPELNPEIIEVNPNSIESDPHIITDDEKIIIRRKYCIPLQSITFIYGGNLGKPQGVDFLLDVLDSNKGNNELFFVIVGDGTEFNKVQSWFRINNPQNAVLHKYVPKTEYDQLLQSCDVGMIFLDKRFTIPNFPSRLLSYLEYKLPVVAATDINTDLGKIIEDNNFGYWVESGNLIGMNQIISKIAINKLAINELGQNGFNYLIKNFTVSKSAKLILSHLNK